MPFTNFLTAVRLASYAELVQVVRDYLLEEPGT